MKIQQIDHGRQSFVEAVLFGPVSHVHAASESRVLLLQPVEGLVEVLEVVVLIHGTNVVMSCKLEHIGNIDDATHVGTDDGNFIIDEILAVDQVRTIGVRSSHHHEDSSWLGQPLVQSMKRWVFNIKGRHDQVIFTLIFGQPLLVGRMLHKAGSHGAERLRIICFGCEGSDYHSHLVSKLKTQVAQSSDTDDGTGCSSLPEALERGVDSDSSAEEWGNLMEAIFQTLRHFEDPIVINLHMGRKPSKVACVIGINPVLAHIGCFLLIGAVVAGVVGVSHRTHSHVVSHLQGVNTLADLGHLSHDLMPWAAGELDGNYIAQEIPHISRACITSEQHREVCRTFSLTSEGSGGKKLKGYLTRLESLLVKIHATASASLMGALGQKGWSISSMANQC